MEPRSSRPSATTPGSDEWPCSYSHVDAESVYWIMQDTYLGLERDRRCNQGGTIEPAYVAGAVMVHVALPNTTVQRVYEHM